MISSSDDQEKPLNKIPAPSNTTEGSTVELEIRRVEFNVYFDGTWNSKFNSNWYNDSNWYQSDRYSIDGKIYDHDDSSIEEKYREVYKADETSFARAPTGVDQMNRAARTNDPYIIPVYVDGSGTETPKDDPYALDDVNDYKGSEAAMKSDSAFGSGLGRGDTGVYAKLEKMCEQVQDKLEAVKKKSKVPIHIVMFDVYGFSRGAATARMFVHRVIKERNKELLTDYGLDLTEYTVMVRFVGLFDTVSSIGTNHTNDVEGDKQGLAFAKGKITSKIVHLVAGHEFRQKFSVTSIQQAVARGYGLEVVLPGNHTDIGDGKNTKKKYNEKTKEYEFAGNVDKKTIIQRKSWSISNMVTTPARAILGVIGDAIEDQNEMIDAMNQASLETAMQILIKQGWFVNTKKTEKTAEKTEILIEEDSPYKMLNVNRALTVGYPKIPTWIMLDLIKEAGAYRFNDNILKKYAISTTKDDYLKQFYEDMQPQVMTRWKANSKDYISDHIINNSQHLLPYVTVSSPKLQKILFNKYLQWPSEVTQKTSEQVVSVSLPRINPKTNQFYRAVISG
ncbi:T6SS phospholipase effector Tle1-like catalytic domain-containing protein [Psychrobacter sp. AOP31-E1-50]|uniref:T6SS phospholipase effector Tle1-like catalytic domain-containing protein n=1 Tax=Psychrobacter sp. AOP31-E1-50 TaxID=3457692 RepID=UPI0040365B48